MTASMQPKGRQTPAAVPNSPFFFSASLARSAQAAALAPQLAAVALASGTTLTLLTYTNNLDPCNSPSGHLGVVCYVSDCPGFIDGLN